MIIGVNHGCGMINTAHFTFPTGLTVYEHEPHSLRNTLEVNGRYYVCGSNRQSILRDKTQNDSCFLLTLAAVAKEHSYRGVNSENIKILIRETIFDSLKNVTIAQESGPKQEENATQTDVLNFISAF